MEQKKVLKQATKQVAIWTIAWVITTALVAFGPKFIWNENIVMTMLAIAVNTVIGIVMIIVNKYYIMMLDELQRKINLESMAIALGAALVAGISYANMDMTDIISFDAEIGHLIMFTSIVYMTALAINNRKYR